MVNTGTVVRAEENQLTVVFDRPEACGDCHACSRGSERCAKHTVVIPGRASVGDEVEVEIDDGHVALASVLAYTIPLLGLILGLACGVLLGRVSPLFAPEPMIALVGLVGVALGYVIMRRLNPLFAENRWQPKVRSVNGQPINTPAE